VKRILIVEDEPKMMRGLRDNLEIEGYDVAGAEDGRVGLQKMTEEKFDLVLLDVMLPHLSGFDVLRQSRAAGCTAAVIMLTAKGEEVDRVLGLELGADDYVMKPFSLRELLARIKAVLRRREGPEPHSDELIRIGTCTVDFGAFRLLRESEEIPTTSREIDLLRYLWEHRHQAVTRDNILNDVWGYDESVSTRTIDNFIVRLRQKLEEDPAHPRHILTVHGTGYRLVP
jgi:DNA-binding response OmpR family regulator